MKTVDDYANALIFVLHYLNTQKMSKKTVDTCLSGIVCLLIREAQQMRDNAVSKKPSMLKYCLDRYETQECYGP